MSQRCLSVIVAALVFLAAGWQAVRAGDETARRAAEKKAAITREKKAAAARAAVAEAEKARAAAIAAQAAGDKPPERATEPAPLPEDAVARREFQRRDTNGDGKLSEAEFVNAAGEADRPLVKRDFHLLDLDRNGSMTLEEFRNVPYLVPRAERGALPDPLARLVEQRLRESQEKWAEIDTNGDGLLQWMEIKDAGLYVAGFGNHENEWRVVDRNRDGDISRDEWRTVLEIWYGMRRPQGELIRAPSGLLINWMYYKFSDRDGNDRIDHTEFVKYGFDGKEAEKRFGEMDNDGNGTVSFAEWSAHDSRLIDLFWVFRGLDTNLDARVDRDELLKNIPDWQRSIAEHMFPGFDLNHDGFLSLDEYAFTPLYLQFVEWHGTKVDRDGDRRLSLEEFQFVPGPSLVGLTAEYFRLLDTNGNGFLDEGEWNFHIPEAPQSRLFAMNADGTGIDLLADVGLFGATYLGSPDWSHDGDTLVFDATPARGQGSDFSRSLIVTLGMSGPEKGKFKKLGYGNCPDWSPDDKRIAFFVNGGNPDNDPPGTWVMNADGSERKLVARGLWSPRWAPDGRHLLCCTTFGTPKNYVLVDLDTGESKPVLADIVGMGVPDWEPSGQRVCLTHRVGGRRVLSLMNLDVDPKSIVDVWQANVKDPRESYFYDNSRPNWSADGRELLFTDNSSGQSILRHVPAAGTRDGGAVKGDAGKGGKAELDPTTLAPDLAHGDVNAVWSPDRRRIVFCSTQPPKEIKGLKPRERK